MIFFFLQILWLFFRCLLHSIHSRSKYTVFLEDPLTSDSMEGFVFFYGYKVSVIKWCHQLKSKQTNLWNPSFSLTKHHKDSFTNWIIIHTCIYMYTFRHQMFTIFDCFLETGFIWIRDTVYNGGPINSRLHREVFLIFILIYSQHSFIIHIDKHLSV